MTSIFLPDLSSESNGFSADLYKIPGLVGEVSQFIADIAPRPNPQFALASAFVTVGTLGARRFSYGGSKTVGTNLFVALSSFAAGNASAFLCVVRRLLDAGTKGNLDAVCGGMFRSSNEIAERLKACPAQLALLPDPRASPSPQWFETAAFFQEATILFSAESWCSAKHAARLGDAEVERPRLSILASDAPRFYRGGLSVDGIVTDLASRFLTFSDRPFRSAGPDGLIEVAVPETLATKLQGLWSMGGGPGAALEPPAMTIITPTQEAADLLRKCGEHRSAMMRKAEKDPSYAAWRHYDALVAKVSLVLAAGRYFEADPGRCRIGADDVEIAQRFVALGLADALNAERANTPARSGRH